MKRSLIIAGISLLCSSSLFAQEDSPAGRFSLGTRNTISMFSDEGGVGVGIGGQARLQISRRINTEWFMDYIPSKDGALTKRQDYHFGWSVMYYPGATVDFSKFLQPYFLAGHCFDLSRISEQKNPSNHAQRWSMATQAGAGTHLNITKDFDCSLSAQYMLHFGKELNTVIDDKDAISFEKESPGGPHGHLLLSVGFNYKLGRLW